MATPIRPPTKLPLSRIQLRSSPTLAWINSDNFSSERRLSCSSTSTPSREALQPPLYYLGRLRKIDAAEGLGHSVGEALEPAALLVGGGRVREPPVNDGLALGRGGPVLEAFDPLAQQGLQPALVARPP